MTPTSAHIRFDPDGMTGVDTALRLSGATHIQCYTYDDSPPILVVNDRRIRVSATVPGADQVTPEDLETAQRLADAAARYLADLERGSQHRARPPMRVRRPEWRGGQQLVPRQATFARLMMRRSRSS